MANIIDILQKRNLLEQVSSDEIKSITDKTVKFYIGFDPTSDSLHLGNLVGIIVSCWLRKCGHIPYFMVGGATGRIGDPSGKSEERPFLKDEEIERNVKSIEMLLKNVLKKAGKGPEPIIVNNNQWFKNFNYIDFLRDVGKYFRVGTMLAKESVKIRLNSSEGLSMTEFSYQVIQAYDFYHMFKHHNVLLQIGGSDQWGNITAGIELARKMSSSQLFGFTFPLLLKSDGTKFGKSEKGSVWLNSEKFSCYDFYQYLFKVADSEVIRLLKMLTFLDIEEINKIEKSMQSSDYIPNSAQKILAQEVTKFVHGEEGLELALKITEKASPGKDIKLDSESLSEIMKDLPHCECLSEEIIGQKIVNVFADTKFAKSKSEVVRLIKNGGAYLNNNRIESQDYIIQKSDIIDNSFIVLGMGRKKKFLISIKNKK